MEINYKYMIRVFFILLVLPFVSCGQSHSRYNLQKSFLIKLNESICIKDNNCFYFSNDSGFSYLDMYFVAENKSKKIIDSVEFSPYKSRIHDYKSPKENDCIVLWETEYEFFSVIIAYYFTYGKLEKMGELKISLPCESCESFGYPIKEIQITKKKGQVVISFLKNVNYRNTDTQQWKEYKPGTLKFFFNILNKEFEVNTDL